MPELTRLPDKTLDKRSKKEPAQQPELSYVTRQEMLTRELQRALYRYIEHLPESIRTVEEVRKKSGSKVARAFADRIVETTYHPSQNLPPEFYMALVDELKKHWQESKPDNAVWSPTDIAAKAQTSSCAIMEKTGNKTINLADSAIQSNADLDATEIQAIQQSIMAGIDTLFDQKQAMAATSETSQSSRAIDEVTTASELQQILDNLTVAEPKNRFDESHETVLEAKTLIFNGVAEHHHVWVDFDGAKRAEGHTYSKYAALIYEDIMHNFDLLSTPEQQAAVELYTDFQRVASLNHAVSSLLKNPEAIAKSKVQQLEHMLDMLKQTRYEKLSALIRLKNEIKFKNTQSGADTIIYLSDRVKFMPRLDHKTIQASIAAQYNQTRRPYEQGKKVDQSQYAMLHNILSQVLEINQLTQEKRRWNSEEEVNGNTDSAADQLIIPQIMIAMSEGADDIIALNAELDGLRSAKARTSSDQFHYSAEISVVPLFEGEDTVAPEKISQYLETMWQYYYKRYGANTGREKFKQNINEVFIAGSDLSKEIGQTSALVKANEADFAIQAFNREHNTDVRLKLGTGEAPFRQGGLWDPEAYLPLVRGKIMEYTPLSPAAAQAKFGDDWAAQQAAEEQAVADNRAFLVRTFGDDWSEKLLRKPHGFNRLLRILPVNSFTNQSFSKESTIVKIDTDRLRRMKREAEQTHDQNMQKRAAGNFAPVPEALKTAAQSEQAFYQTLFGKTGQPKSPFGQLLQFCAKSLPAPVLRDRPLGRDSSADDPIQFFNKLAEPHIDARAIGANAVSGFLFPLYLVGKGSMLAAAQARGQLTEVMGHEQIDVKELLRQMKVYGEIAPEIFAMLRQHGMATDADLLEAEWKKLTDLRTPIQEEMWRQESPEQADFTLLTATQKKQLAECFVPGMRELLEDDFVSDRTILFKENFRTHKSIVATAMEYVQAGSALTHAIKQAAAADPTTSTGALLQCLKENSTAAPQELQEKFMAFKGATAKKDAITSEKFGQFMADVVHSYSPGM